jgi:hypothetical protein
MKTPFLIFMTMSCAALIHGVSHAAPLQPSQRDVPADRSAGNIETPGNFSRRDGIPSVQTRSPLKTVRNSGSGAATIGGPANPTKAASVITGAVNPEKNTVAVNGTGMNRKP